MFLLFMLERKIDVMQFWQNLVILHLLAIHLISPVDLNLVRVREASQIVAVGSFFVHLFSAFINYM